MTIWGILPKTDRKSLPQMDLQNPFRRNCRGLAITAVRCNFSCVDSAIGAKEDILPRGSLSVIGAGNWNRPAGMKCAKFVKTPAVVI